MDTQLEEAVIEKFRRLSELSNMMADFYLAENKDEALCRRQLDVVAEIKGICVFGQDALKTHPNYPEFKKLFTETLRMAGLAEKDINDILVTFNN